MGRRLDRENELLEMVQSSKSSNNKVAKRQKVLASIAAICAAGTVASVAIGGEAINQTNAQNKEMESIVTKTYNSQEYKNYISNEENTLYEAYRNGELSLSQYQTKLNVLHSIDTLKKNPDEHMTDKDASRYNTLKEEYLNGGWKLAVGIFGFVGCGAVSTSCASYYFEERERIKKEKLLLEYDADEHYQGA